MARTRRGDSRKGPPEPQAAAGSGKVGLGIVLLVPAAAAAVVGALLLRRRGRKERDAAPPVDVDSKPRPVTLQWRDVSCTLQRKKDGVAPLLQGISGSAAPGRLTAILGPSGAGKTCVPPPALRCTSP